MFLFVDPYKSQSAKAGAHSDIGLQSKDTRWVSYELELHFETNKSCIEPKV